MSQEQILESDLDRLKLSFEHDGRVARLLLNAPRANVIDTTMIAALEQALTKLESRTELRAIVLGAAGPHFSYGASVEEHLPDAIGSTLMQLHTLLRRFQHTPAPTIAAVHGRCLGGGLELALACDLILMQQGAVLACPEIQLGVFAPAASVLLPLRIAGGHATRSLLTGSEWHADDAIAAGLADRLAPDDLENALQDWLSHDFLPRSPAGLKHAARAARVPKIHALEHTLPKLEHAYLEDLCIERDGFEGIRAFVEKRQPRWHDERSD